jgi:hypothetical protein
MWNGDKPSKLSLPKSLSHKKKNEQINGSCLKPQKFGVICCTAIDNS